MNYKDFYSELFKERYGGAKKEVGIWYHGTSMKRIPLIMSRGLDPEISPKHKSWGQDPDVSVTSLDRTSYGGIYVTKNIGTATASAFRTSRQDKRNRAIIILELQPRTLTADEDDIADRIKSLSPHLAGSIYHSIYPYMWEAYGVPNYHKEYHEKSKNEWVKRSLETLFFDFKIDDLRFKEQVRQMLFDEGYKAMLTRTVSHANKKENRTDHWEWRKAYAEVHGMGNNYGEEVDIPDPPSPSEGERTFRSFVDKLTRTMKHKARHGFTGSFSKTARSLQPIGFHGKNRIVAIVELVKSQTSEYSEDIKIIYGELPEDFKNQWKERIGDLTIVQ